MSTHWGYYCKTCGKSSEMTMNHGDSVLREAYQYRDFIAELQNCGAVECRIEYAHGDETWFLLDHKDHEMCLMNEYGEMLTLRDEQRGGNAKPPRCFRELVSGDGLRGEIQEIPNDVPRTVRTVVKRNSRASFCGEAAPTISNDCAPNDGRDYTYYETQDCLLFVYREDV